MIILQQQTAKLPPIIREINLQANKQLPEKVSEPQSGNGFISTECERSITNAVFIMRHKWDFQAVANGNKSAKRKVLLQGHRGAFDGQILRELVSDSLMNTFILCEDLKVVKKKL